MPALPINILRHTAAQFEDAAAAHGLSAHRARAIYRAAFREAFLERPAVADVCPIIQTVDEDGTVKFLQQLPGGLETESVIIPGTGSSGTPRATLCVSSQVGCAMGCTFCETAQMGLMANLDVSQIVGQWYAARFLLQAPVRNVVFMGMGEPLDNLQCVMDAIEVLADQNGPNIAVSRITVSTVGRAEGIDKLAGLARRPGFGKLCLAVSINASNDAVRGEIMPVNRATPMARLMESMQAWPGRRVLIEYVLIPGVNDEDAHADELCDYLRDLECIVNVIPYNPRRDSPWPAPTEASVDHFTARIATHDQPVRRRQTHGRTVMAACGQLGNEHIRRRRVIGPE